MKNPMATLKKWLSGVLTLLTLAVLFAVIFIEGGWAAPNAQFFKELAVVVGLTLSMKFWWYDWAEDKRLSEEDISTAKTNYYKMVDDNIQDSNDLDKFLVILNQENREFYIRNKIGSRNEQTLATKNFFIRLLHPSWFKLTAEKIGELRYVRLYIRVCRKADKLRKIKSAEIMALSYTTKLYDSRNYMSKHKRTYQLVTTIASVLLTVLFASMALEQIVLNWLNVFRYVSYVCSITFTISMTIAKAYKQTGDDMFDYLNRIKYIIDKYATYKKEVNQVNE